MCVYVYACEKATWNLSSYLSALKDYYRPINSLCGHNVQPCAKPSKIEAKSQGVSILGSVIKKNFVKVVTEPVEM